MSEEKIRGLLDEEVAESRAKYGRNVLTPPREDSWWRKYLRCFKDPLIIILLIAGVLSIGISFYEYFGLSQDWKVFFEPIGIFVAILLATGLSFIFEQKANREFRILNHVDEDDQVEVLRNGHVTTVPRKDIVVGDIVYINSGDEVPADGHLLDAVSLSVDESTLTGEAMCHKTVHPEDFDPDATYPSDSVMRGTQVIEGHGVMRVARVGDNSEEGRIFSSVRGGAGTKIDKSVRTPLNEQLDGLALLITNGSYIVAGLVIAGLLVHYLGWGDWLSWLVVVPVIPFVLVLVKTNSFQGWARWKAVTFIIMAFVLLFGCAAGSFALMHPEAGSAGWSGLMSRILQTLMVAVTLVVVAVPEGLPMAVTLSLAYSMRRMLKTNNLVRRMHACETMGAATVICTDKTGTLTQNQMKVYAMNLCGDIPQELFYEGIAVNSTAQLDDSHGKVKALGNPTEGALLLWLRSRGVDYEALRAKVRRIEELPFSTERKYMATVVKSATGRKILYVKGAPEIVYGLCADNGGVSREELDRELHGYQDMAMRTLGFAYQELHEGDMALLEHSVVADGLQYIGTAAISDPVREDVPAAVYEVLDAGVKVKIVTGDTPGTAREIARQIGLWHDGEDGEKNIITGPEFAKLTDRELRDRVGDLKIIARARPMDKKRLVETLQADNEVVAVTGDGTNDAPALKAAHVGLSMGDGTSVAKEASDITIIDNSFSSIGRAVMWGRSLYQNIQRFLLFQLTVNVAACLLVLVGSFIGSESPLTVTQMLWVNLIMDTFGAMALSSLPPSPGVMRDKPRNRHASIISGPMARELAGVGFIFFAITLAFYCIFCSTEVTSMIQMFHAPAKSDGEMSAYEMTLLFSIFVWTHFWYMFNARAFETGRSLFRLKMSQGFWTIVAVIVVGQLFITEIAYEFFSVSPMFHTPDWKWNGSGALDFAIIVGAGSLVVWIRELYRLFTSKI